jgi:hypothetical protein
MTVAALLGALLQGDLFNAGRLATNVLPFGLRVTVPTAAAGFKTTPCYNVRMDGSRISALDLREDHDDDDNGDNGEGPIV